MAVSRLIFVLLYSLFAFQTQGEQQEEPPAWTRSPAEPNLFVVETKEFSTHFDVTNGLVPAIRSGVTKWAQNKFGEDCGKVIESIPLEKFRELIHENQEHVHESRRIYDAETAKRLEADYDIYYRGYVRVSINDTFRNQVQERVNKFRLKNRLCTALVTAILVFGVAAIGWAYLFANRISRGFYIGRLRWIAGGLVTTLIIVCYSISQMLF